MPRLLVHTNFGDGLRLKKQYVRNHTSDHHDKHIDTKLYPLRVHCGKSAVKKLFKRLRYMAKREGRQVVGSPRQNATVLGLWNSYEARSFSSR